MAASLSPVCRGVRFAAEAVNPARGGGIGPTHFRPVPLNLLRVKAVENLGKRVSNRRPVSQVKSLLLCCDQRSEGAKSCLTRNSGNRTR